MTNAFTKGLVLLVVATVGCHVAGSHVPSAPVGGAPNDLSTRAAHLAAGPATGAHNGFLTGVWRLRLRIDARSPTSSRDSVIEATVAFIRSAPLKTSVYASRQHFEYIGVYDGSLEEIGVDPLPRRDVPIAFASTVPPDSFVITLNPGVSHGAAILHGSLRDGEGSGRWVVSAYALGAHGDFTMRPIR